MSKFPSFKVKTDDFLSVTNYVERAVSDKNIVPIYQSLMLIIEDGICRVIGSNTETQISGQVKVDSKDNFRICVPCTLFLSTIKSLKTDAIKVTANSTEKMAFNTAIQAIKGKKKYNIASHNPDTMDIQVIDETKGVSVDCNSLVQALANTAPIVDAGDPRGGLRGIRVNYSKDHLQLTAVGNAVMTMQFIRAKGEIEQIVLTKDMCRITAGIKQGGNAELFSSERKVGIKMAGLTIISTLISEKYPEVERFWKNKRDEHIVVNRVELLEALRRISLYNMNNLLLFEMDDKNLTVSADDVNSGNDASEILPISNNGIGSTSAGYNATFMIQAVDSLETEMVAIHMPADPKSHGFFQPVDYTGELNQSWIAMPYSISKAQEKGEIASA